MGKTYRERAEEKWVREPKEPRIVTLVWHWSPREKIYHANSNIPGLTVQLYRKKNFWHSSVRFPNGEIVQSKGKVRQTALWVAWDSQQARTLRSYFGIPGKIQWGRIDGKKYGKQVQKYLNDDIPEPEPEPEIRAGRAPVHRQKEKAVHLPKPSFQVRRETDYKKAAKIAEKRFGKPMSDQEFRDWIAPPMMIRRWQEDGIEFNYVYISGREQWSYRISSNHPWSIIYKTEGQMRSALGSYLKNEGLTRRIM